MAKIKGSGRLLFRLTNPQFVQFCTILRLQLPQYVAGVPRLAAIWARLQAAIARLDESFKWPLTAEETEIIKQKDIDREGVMKIICDAIKNLARHAVDSDLKAAAKALLYQVLNYEKARKLDYEAETAMIDNFIQAITSAVNAPRLALVGQTAMANTLLVINNGFQDFYNERYARIYAHKQSGTTTHIRGEVVAIFNDFTVGTNGLLVTETDPDILSDLNAIGDSVNAAIDQYTINLNRHLGLLQHKKDKDKDSGNDNGKEDAETQAPDTTLPEAPDMPPQTPDATPPAINPDDLNPPAVGER
ncbi:MAG: DUF6261 family protein [Tannerellaceae bacterium]|jgi:hypothetical protein|nr:DUF6261 family protein [Tannerellaceae bacterium]